MNGIPGVVWGCLFLTIRKKVYEEARKSHPKRWQKKENDFFRRRMVKSKTKKETKKEKKNEVKAS